MGFPLWTLGRRCVGGWFWRGWFYSTDYVDLAIDDVKWFKINTRNPEIEKSLAKAENSREDKYIANVRNKEAFVTQVELNDSLKDFYNSYDPYEVTILDRQEHQDYLDSLEQDDLEFLNKDYNYYEATFSNIGGLVMPLILQFDYADGSQELIRIPAEIWRKNNNTIHRVFVTKKEIESIAIDPHLETADIDMNNNFWPPRIRPTRFQLYKRQIEENEMQKAKRAKEQGVSDDIDEAEIKAN